MSQDVPDDADIALDNLFGHVQQEINELKNKIAQQQADIQHQENTIESLEQDAIQHEEEKIQMTCDLNYYEQQLQILKAQLESTEHDHVTLDDLHAANQRIRELKEKAESELVDVKKENNQLLDLIWNIFSDYNTLINKLTDVCVSPDTNDVSQELNETAQTENEKIVENVVNEVNTWDKKNTDYAAAMALIFNQEQRRIALRKRFSRANTPRRRWF